MLTRKYVRKAFTMNSNHHEDEDDDTRFLLYKIWCHGQSIAPPILGILSCFSKQPSTVESIFIMVLLSIWPVVSWKAMQAQSTLSFRCIVIGGLLVECIYTYILIKTPLRNGTAIGMLIFIATALLMVETLAYLVVMWWNRTWFNQQSESGESSRRILGGNNASQS